MCNLKKIRNAVKAKVKDTKAGNGGLIKIHERGKGDVDLVFGKLTLSDKELAEGTLVLDVNELYKEYPSSAMSVSINIILAAMPVDYAIYTTGTMHIIYSKEWSVILNKTNPCVVVTEQ